MFMDWIDKGFFPDHPEVEGESTEFFLSQEAIIFITGNWSVAAINDRGHEFETGIAPFPGSVTCADGGSQVNFAGSAYLMAAHTEHPDIAAEYINFHINRPDTARIWMEVGDFIPPYLGAYDANVSALNLRVLELLQDESLQNIPGINMWLGPRSFDFFSTSPTNLINGSLPIANFTAAADEALAADIEAGLTKATFGR